ncbi:hypothetical protein BN11_5030005 [Nostocoides australiense Ben110]|uniref:Uncharacterized protein n=1 Tax=Nostocoides australiense Ben110 TaxID=1193182 RepID=W6K221_9MICO|nr:hypothetical protein [Tetrasphaera australiensis]CCH75085.1 hypothetical protein BN11_5030005 [Tetrasphaera australiensis Ben110]
MSTNAADLDREAIDKLGKPYADCNPDEREAVEFGVLAAQIIDAMCARGVRTFGELFEDPRKETGK